MPDLLGALESVTARDALPFALSTWLIAIGAAYVLRSKFFAIFVAVLVGLEALVTVAIARHVGPLVPLLLALHAAIIVQMLALSRPRLRSLPYRLLVSWPAYYYLGGAILALPLAAMAPFVGAPTPAWFQALLCVPFALAAFGMLQSLTGREESLRLDLAAARQHATEAGGPQWCVPRRGRPHRTGPRGRPRRRPPAHSASSRSRTRTSAPSCPSRASAASCSAPWTATRTSCCSRGTSSPWSRSETSPTSPTRSSPSARFPGRAFACFGNHDHEAPHIVTNALEAAGVTLLIDAATLTETPAGPVQIVGADFHFQGRHEQLARLAAAHPRVPGALRPLAPARPRRVLSHPRGRGGPRGQRAYPRRAGRAGLPRRRVDRCLPAHQDPGPRPLPSRPGSALRAPRHRALWLPAPPRRARRAEPPRDHPPRRPDMTRRPPALAFALALLSSCAPGSSNLPLVINEVRGTPVEYVEIANLADRDIPLTRVEIGGSAPDGTPDARELRTRLPAIALRPGERFVVALGRLDADGELHDARECNIPDVSECAFATFRVNATAGETVHLFEGTRHIDAFAVPRRRGRARRELLPHPGRDRPRGAL